MLAALELFGRNGYEATAIGDIASRARASIGAFYQYFRSKRQLLLVLMNELLAKLEHVEMRPQGAPDLRSGIERTDRNNLTHHTELAVSRFDCAPRLKWKRRRPSRPPPQYGLSENARYEVFAGLAESNFKVIWATPAATFKPFCPSIETGCKAIELFKPPMSTLAPAPTPTAALAVAPP